LWVCPDSLKSFFQCHDLKEIPTPLMIHDLSKYIIYCMNLNIE